MASERWFPLRCCSPDILREIFVHLTAIEISLLYLCGNATLNFKIGTPRTVQEWNMRLDVDGCRKWPSLISYLKTLRKIDIVAAFPTHFTDIFGLPKTLESIRFEFWEAESLFALPLSQPEMAQSIADGPMVPNFVNMRLLFPRLKHLQLEGSECVSDFFISTLPDALETLEICSDRRGTLIMVTEACLDLLPRSLKRLKMTAPFLNNPASFSKLPRSLTSLELSGGSINGPCLLHLPPELVSLVVPNMPGFLDIDVQHLPPTLEVLNVLEHENLSYECFSTLPRNLKELTMWRLNGTAVRLTPIVPFIASLPQELKWLKVVKAKAWDNAATQVLPKHLEYLVLHEALNLTDEFARVLPRSLVSLVLFCATPQVSSACFVDLPRSLTKLEMASRARFVDADCAFLPNLLDLDLSYAIQLTNDCIVLLPRSLTRLYLRHNAQISGRSAIDLPRHLRTFSLSTSQSYSGQYFTHLPRSLTHLALHSVVDVLPDALKALPLNLKYLDLFSVQRFNSHHLPYLPPGIRHLTLHSVDLSNQYHVSRFQHGKRAETARLSPEPLSSSSALWKTPLSMLWNLLSPSGH